MTRANMLRYFLKWQLNQDIQDMTLPRPGNSSITWQNRKLYKMKESNRIHTSTQSFKGRIYVLLWDMGEWGLCLRSYAPGTPWFRISSLKFSKLASVVWDRIGCWCHLDSISQMSPGVHVGLGELFNPSLMCELVKYSWKLEDSCLWYCPRDL